MQKALAMAKSVNEGAAPDYKGRIYTPAYGPGNVLVFEDVHESVAEREEYWEKYYGTPEFEAWWEEWNEIAETGGSIEVWNLTEV
jgi:hypothetical protein